jgi:RES domain-containing protein
VTRDPHALTLGEQVWYRVADSAWTDPLDPTYADRAGGRWNAPGDGPTLYLNADRETARAQIPRMLRGTAIDVEDLRDDAPFVLVPVRLPARQRVADATTDTGLTALGLPRSYPARRDGTEVPWSVCRRSAAVVRRARLRGVLARSAALPDGRELAWFPARTARATSAGATEAFATWRHPDAPSDGHPPAR